MTSSELENLARIGRVKREPAPGTEFEVDDRLLLELIKATRALLTPVRKAGPP